MFPRLSLYIHNEVPTTPELHFENIESQRWANNGDEFPTQSRSGHENLN